MFDQFKSIAKSYIPRLRKAVDKAVAFVKRNKKSTLAAAGIVAGIGVSVVVRSLTNTVKEDDWVKDACDLVRSGEADFLIASNSKSGASMLFAPADVIANTLSKHAGLTIEY